MNSFFQSFFSSLYLLNSTRHSISTSDAGTFKIDFSCPNYFATLPPETAQSQEDPLTDGETEGDDDKTIVEMFDITTIDNDDIDDDDDNWNVRGDYEEKDHVYYVPPGAYRSYVLGESKKDNDEKDSKERKSEQTSKQLEIEAIENVDANDDDKWNIRSDDEEKDFVYHMPSGAYRSYELGGREKAGQESSNGNDVLRACVGVVGGDHNTRQARMGDQDSIDFCEEDSGTSVKHSSNNMKEDIDSSLDMTTLQSMANRTRIPTEPKRRKNLCRVCRNFHDAKNIDSEKRGVRLDKRLLSWRKKSHKQPCANCGLAVDRRSFLKRLLRVAKKVGGTF